MSNTKPYNWTVRVPYPRETGPTTTTLSWSMTRMMGTKCDICNSVKKSSSEIQRIEYGKCEMTASLYAKLLQGDDWIDSDVEVLVCSDCKDFVLDNFIKTC